MEAGQETSLRVLFVDDEPNVLEGLQRMLRRYRHEWSMRFVEAGKQALEILANEPYDVVVSDIRMPSMDGVELLTEVQARHPEVIRVILSGQAGQHALVRAVGPAHQYLSKPCDADALVATIQRATALRRNFRHQRLTRLVARMGSLPSLPSIYKEIMAELRSEEPSIRRLAEIVAKDVAMSAKVLQLVNSAFFGLPNRITDTCRAVMHLGTDTVRALALSTGVFSQLEESLPGRIHVEALLAHSSQVAALAKAIAEVEEAPRDVVDACFQAGFLHDIGKLVLMANMPDRYGEILERAVQEHVPPTCVESEILGASHAEVGGYLLGIWGLPDPVVEAVMFHHRPSGFPTEGFSPLLAVHVADHLQHQAAASGQASSREELDAGMSRQTAWSDHYETWERVARRVLREEGKREQENPAR